MAQIRGVSDNYYYITSANTYQVKEGRGRLYKIVFNKPVASSTVKVIDGTAGSTANIATITNTSAEEPYELCYDLIFRHGLRIVTSGADDITILYD